MDAIEKLKAFNITKADAEKDIALINQFSLKELKPEDVLCFSLVLCDNEVDRDMEKFPVKSLETLAGMFVGRTGIKDHSWAMRNQVARLYRVELQKTAAKNSLGEQLVQLMGSAYMLRTPENESLSQPPDELLIGEQRSPVFESNDPHIFRLDEAVPVAGH